MATHEYKTSQVGALGGPYEIGTIGLALVIQVQTVLFELLVGLVEDCP